MKIASRLLRVALAAATLHLMMVSPARTCDHLERAATPMTHAGHEMPTPATPSQDHGQPPCCPTMPAGCVSVACTIAPVEAVALAMSSVPTATVAPPTMYAVRWQSLSNAPEPPPPRA